VRVGLSEAAGRRLSTSCRSKPSPTTRWGGRIS
jgi:hypothetical protein